MKKQLITPFLFLAIIFLASCAKDNDLVEEENVVRYQNEMFSTVNVQTVTYDAANNLKLDIYTPGNDTATNRRLVLLAHGGAFVQGSRANPYMIDLATKLAKYGYTAISYDYRLAANIYDMLDSVASMDVVVKSLVDGNNVLDHVWASHNNGNPYGIDPFNVALLGNSAGAVLSVQLTQLDQSDFLSANLQSAVDSNGGWNALMNSASGNGIKAVVSLAGAIHRTDWLNVDGPALIMAHGTADDVVPYGCGNALSAFSNATLELCGAQSMGPAADAIGLEQYTLIFDGAAHCPWMDDANIGNEVFQFVIEKLNATMD